MRKLTKFFIAVVLLAAYSCATDTTEDLGVKHGQGLTEITVSIEESRMQLGAENNGLYPLYWSEGDQISVNGLPSNVLTKEEAGKASATLPIQQQLRIRFSLLRIRCTSTTPPLVAAFRQCTARVQ